MKRFNKRFNPDSLSSTYKLAVEPLYKTPYIESDIPIEWKKSFSSLVEIKEENTSLKLRKRNMSITKEVDIVSCFGVGKVIDENDTKLFEECKNELYTIKPETIVNKPKLKVFYKLDRTFYTPKSNFYLNIIPHNIRDEKSSGGLFIFSEYLKLHLKTELADLLDSGNSLSIEVNDNGIDIFVSTFTDLSLATFSKTIQTLFNYEEFKKSNFEELKRFCMYLNTVEESSIPFNKSSSILNKIIKINVTQSWKNNDNLKKLTYGDFKNMIEEVIQKVYIKALIYGNFPKKDLYQIQFELDSIIINGKYQGKINNEKIISEKLIKNEPKSQEIDAEKLSLEQEELNRKNSTDEKTEKLNKRKLPVSKVNHNKTYREIPNNEEEIFPVNLLKKYEFPTVLKTHKQLIGEFVYKIQKKENEENMLSVYFQVGERTPKNYVLSELMEIAWGNIFVYNLKTVKNLGYYISSLSREMDDVMYVEIIIQSNYSVEVLSSELNQVFEKLKKRIKYLDNSRIAAFKNQMYIALNVKESSLRERTERVWNEIYDGIYDFDFKEECKKILDEVTKEDLIEFYFNVFEKNVNRLSIIYSDSEMDNKKKRVSVKNENNNAFLLGTEITEENIKNFSVAYVNKSVSEIENSGSNIQVNQERELEKKEKIENKRNSQISQLKGKRVNGKDIKRENKSNRIKEDIKKELSTQTNLLDSLKESIHSSQ